MTTNPRPLLPVLARPYEVWSEADEDSIPYQLTAAASAALGWTPGGRSTVGAPA
jgi:hypothetical protein